mmetsp:Transcript_61529/g.169069  ORF Transcript_61529/g.169069 Transcript_61529/m.169069 type:complete len:215 (+) Transcript_61529:860-1504(+)
MRVVVRRIRRDRRAVGRLLLPLAAVGVMVGRHLLIVGHEPLSTAAARRADGGRQVGELPLGAIRSAHAVGSVRPAVGRERASGVRALQVLPRAVPLVVEPEGDVPEVGPLVLRRPRCPRWLPPCRVVHVVGRLLKVGERQIRQVGVRLRLLAPFEQAGGLARGAPLLALAVPAVLLAPGEERSLLHLRRQSFGERHAIFEVLRRLGFANGVEDE